VKHVIFAISLLLAALNASQARAEGPEYPRVDLAISYEVDPSWPQRPEGIRWGAVSGIAVDADDRVWVFTRDVPPVQLYEANGKFVRAWGEQHIKTAHHLKIDSKGNVWVADIGNHVVMQFTPEGKILRTLGTVGQAGEDETHLNMPTDMAVTADGDVFVSDGYGNNRVVHFDAQGKFVNAWGKMGVEPGEFSLPHAIALDSEGKLYVADRNNVRVQVFDQQGKFIDQWTDIVTPWGFWITAKDEVWVCGSTPTTWRYSAPEEPLGCPPRDQVFMKFNTGGRLLQLWTIPKAIDGQEKPGELNWLHCLAIDSKGDIYAGDIIGKRAQKFVRQ
jgi:hypothetical protein